MLITATCTCTIKNHIVSRFAVKDFINCSLAIPRACEILISVIGPDDTDGSDAFIKTRDTTAMASISIICPWSKDSSIVNKTNSKLSNIVLLSTCPRSNVETVSNIASRIPTRINSFSSEGPHT